MLLLAFRSFFFVAVILGYSTGVWRLINDYFRKEFKTFLAEEVRRNKYLMADAGGAGYGQTTQDPLPTPMPGSEPKPSSGSVTANRLLDELIISFGRLFTTSQRPTVAPQDADQPTLLTKSTIRDTQEGKLEEEHQSTMLNPASSTPDPGGTHATVIDGKTMNEADNEIWSTSSSSTPVGRSDGDDEDKWLNYWRQRQIGGRAEEVETERGHCKAVPANDGCHP